MSNILSEMRRAKYTINVTILNAVILIQYGPRILQIYRSLKELEELDIPINIRASFNFFLYLLAGHVSFQVCLHSNFFFFFTLAYWGWLIFVTSFKFKNKKYFIENKWKLHIYTNLFLSYWYCCNRYLEPFGIFSRPNDWHLVGVKRVYIKADASKVLLTVTTVLEISLLYMISALLTQQIQVPLVLEYFSKPVSPGS